MRRGETYWVSIEDQLPEQVIFLYGYGRKYSHSPYTTFIVARETGENRMFFRTDIFSTEEDALCALKNEMHEKCHKYHEVLHEIKRRENAIIRAKSKK